MKEESDKISQDEIEKCISILEKLTDDNTQVFDLPEDQRVALMKAAGKLSRPNREEFKKRKKNAKKAAER
ncbi:MAG: oxidoreductase, partial [Vicingaceae bacterium]|nr:oxidoreductase [Vicingaceae bacterium]